MGELWKYQYAKLDHDKENDRTTAKQTEMYVFALDTHAIYPRLPTGWSKIFLSLEYEYPKLDLIIDTNCFMETSPQKSGEEYSPIT